jgi:hypothetical protein
MRARTAVRGVCWLAAGGLVGVCALLPALADPPTPAGGPAAPVSAAQIKPKWTPGDKWVVETTTKLPQVRDDQANKTVVAQWEFTVLQPENIGTVPFYRLRVKGLGGEDQPETNLWLDQKSLALVQFQTQIPVPGGFTTLTESYSSSSGQPAPVVGPITAVPIDMPLFLPSARGKFSYDASSGPVGAKRAIGDIKFTVDIDQQVSAAKPEAVKNAGLPNSAFTKSLEAKPVFEVKLETPDRTVRQLWQAEQPWPVFSDNGSTTARLIKVSKANP